MCFNTDKMYRVDTKLLELQNNSDMELMMSLSLKWTKKSDSKDLLKFQDALFRSFRYIQTREDERFSYDRIISESISNKNRAIERARKAEERIDELDLEIKKLKIIQGL